MHTVTIGTKKKKREKKEGKKRKKKRNGLLYSFSSQIAKPLPLRLYKGRPEALCDLSCPQEGRTIPLSPITFSF